MWLIWRVIFMHETKAKQRTIGTSRGGKNGANCFIFVHIFKCIFAMRG